MRVQVLAYRNAMLVEVLGVYDVALTTDPASPVYLNSKTVQVTLYREDGSTPANVTWPLTLSYVAASNGDYRGTVVYTVGLRPGDRGRAVVTFDGGGDLRGEWEFPFVVQTREA